MRLELGKLSPHLSKWNVKWWYFSTSSMSVVIFCPLFFCIFSFWLSSSLKFNTYPAIKQKETQEIIYITTVTALPFTIVLQRLMIMMMKTIEQKAKYGNCTQCIKRFVKRKSRRECWLAAQFHVSDGREMLQSRPLDQWLEWRKETTGIINQSFVWLSIPKAYYFSDVFICPNEVTI